MATDWVPAATAAIGAAAAVGGQAVTAVFQGRNQERAEQRQRREQVAATLAEVRALLTDAEPMRLGSNASQEIWPETFTMLRNRFAQIRIPLLTVGTGHPSGKTRTLAIALETALSNSLISADLAVRELLSPMSTAGYFDAAKEDHAEARRLADELARAIHET